MRANQVKHWKQEAITVTGIWSFYLNGKLVKREKNLVVTTGLGLIASLMANDQTNDCSVHLAWGTGTTAAAAGDTTLEIEEDRKAITTRRSSGAVLEIRTFLLTTEGNGDWTEFGIFFVGTDDADSGTLLNRILPVGGVSKTILDTLTVEVEITFAAA